VLHGSFCDRARRGREFQEGSARFVKFTVVSASEKTFHVCEFRRNVAVYRA